MSVRSRARGDKEPTGRTKTAILLFLANRGESTFTEIREHMLERYNIRSQKDIRGHLNDLSDEGKLGMLEKRSNGKGNACSYRVRDGFGSLKRLYNYMNTHGAGTELMRARYFAELTSSCDFSRKITVNVLGRIISDLYQCICSEEGMRSLSQDMLSIPRDHRNAILNWMERVRRRDTSDPLSRQFIEMAEADSSPDAGAMEAYVQPLVERGMVVIGPAGLDAITAALMMPVEYWGRITAILRLSPGAFDYVMNLTCDNALFPRNPYLVYAILLLIQGEPAREPALTVEDCIEYARRLPRLSPEPPIFLIARSYFISDLVDGRLAVKQVPEETLRLILGDAA